MTSLDVPILGTGRTSGSIDPRDPYSSQIGKHRDGFARNQGPPKLTEADNFAKEVERKWKEGGDALMRQRRDYWVNLSYYLGEQWIWWNKQRNVPQTLPQQWSPLGPGRAKLTINRLAAIIQALFGQLMKSELAFDVTPSQPADDKVLGARRAEKILEAYHDDEHWETVRHDAIFAAYMGGTSAIGVEWDGSAGEQVEFDEASNTVVGTGEPRLSAYAINEFCIEPHVRDYTDARWWMSGLALPPRSVAQQYGLDWVPAADAGTTFSPLQMKLLEDSGKAAGRDLCQVLTYYERPGRGSRGAYAIVVNGRVIHREVWPFPFDHLNMVCFRQRKVHGRWTGQTVVNDAINIQFAYNHARSVLAEHMKLAGNARMIAPQGAFDEDDLTDDPAGVLWYTSDLSGGKPEYMAPPNLPGWLTNEAATLSGELDDIMSQHAVSRGIGFSRASGQALAFLAEQDNTPLALFAYDQRRGWGLTASMVLQLLAEKGPETRTRTLPIGKQFIEPVEWNGKMLRGMTRVTVPLDAVMPKSHTAQLGYAKDLWDRQIVTDPRKYARMVGLPPDQFEELLDADAANANRENLRMACGIAEVPEPFDDDGIHIAEHNRMRKSDAYRYAEPKIRSIFDDHVMYHEHRAAQQYGLQVQRAQADPGIAALPQANEPPGSDVPLPAQQQEQMALQGGGPQAGSAGAGRRSGARTPGNGVPLPAAQSAGAAV